MKYKYEFESNSFERGDCSECPIAYELYDPEHEERVDTCPIGSPKECPLEEVKGEMSLTDFVDTTIVKVRNDMCNNYCKFEKECGEAVDQGEDYPCPLAKL